MAKKDEVGREEGGPRFIPRYPAIEKLIDSEDFDTINANFGAAYRKLEALAKQQGLGKSRDAKKGMKALERTMDLLAYLLKLKFQYLEAQGQTVSGGEKSPSKKVKGEKQLQGSGAR